MQSVEVGQSRMLNAPNRTGVVGDLMIGVVAAMKSAMFRANGLGSVDIKDVQRIQFE